MEYPKLQKAMQEKNENCITLTVLLGLSGCNVSKRMNKITDFRISEIETLMKHYNKRYEELFR